MTPIDLKELSIIELKALAYDCIAEREQAERNLTAVNKEITIRNNKKEEDVN